MKSTYITIRVSEEEKKQMQEDAKKAGFDNVSVYILWLYRQQRRLKG